jgi:uncharacterized paraquat-inducible protein A
MSNEIKILKNNENREWSDIEWVNEFYQFLQGNCPDRIKMKHPPKLSAKKAFQLIWYLQEQFPLIPDQIEQCSFCDELFDSDAEGYYHEKTSKHYCDSCDTSLDDGHDVRCYKCTQCGHEQDKYSNCKGCKSKGTLEKEYI